MVKTLISFFQRPEVQHFFLWNLVVFGADLFFIVFFQMNPLHWIFLLALSTAIFLLRDHPFRSWGLSQTLENMTIAVLIVGFVIHFSWVVIAPKIEAGELAGQPCQPSNVELRCYTFSQDMCEMVWNRFEKDCKDEARQKMNPKNVSALVGAGVRQCIYQKIDKSFRANRRLAVDPVCQTHFSRFDSLN